MPELPTYRMLITGSRSWKGIRPIDDAIHRAAIAAAQLGRDLVVIHGAAAGADKLAQSVVVGRRHAGWTHIHEEAHPAPWDAPCIERCRPGHRRWRAAGGDYCPAAGRYRNEEMVNLGADECMAFIKDQSPGATHCAKLAESAGIHTTRIVWERLK